MNFENITFTVDNGIARITLNRPDKLNSFTDDMHAELRVALEDREVGFRHQHFDVVEHRGEERPHGLGRAQARRGVRAAPPSPDPAGRGVPTRRSRP